MAKKRKTLPKDFGELIASNDIAALKEVFEKCELNATGGYEKGTALGFFNIPSELVRWLVEQGADINATDTYGNTPLHHHAMRRSGDVTVFLELGANINAVNRYNDTPLHLAAGSAFSPQMVRALVQSGASVLAKNDDGKNPLVRALNRANNIDIQNLPAISDILLEAGTPITEDMRKSITRIGEGFEFHREGFNKDFLPATDAALFQLYQMFDVAPVSKRKLHDGLSIITVSSVGWENQFSELWGLLVPSSGAAKTVQGEVVRIAGRVQDEIFRNGGGNWDNHFRLMLDGLITHLSSGVPLDENLLNEATSIAKAIRRSGNGNEELFRLCELTVKWVLLNPNPVALGTTDYDR